MGEFLHILNRVPCCYITRLHEGMLIIITLEFFELMNIIYVNELYGYGKVPGDLQNVIV